MVLKSYQSKNKSDFPKKTAFNNNYGMKKLKKTNMHDHSVLANVDWMLEVLLKPSEIILGLVGNLQ